MVIYLKMLLSIARMGGLTQNAEEPPSPHVFQSSTLKFKPVLTPVTPLGQGFCMVLILLVERIVSVELMQLSFHMRVPLRPRKPI